MCFMDNNNTPAPPPTPAGAGMTVADVDTGKDKYTKVYDEKQNDITNDVTFDSKASKYRKKQTTDAAIDTYAGGY